MLDIGWTELLVIAVVLIVVVGPKDLPPMLRAFGKMTTRLRKTAGDFRAQFDEALREAELDDVRQTISDVRGLHPANSLRDAINPLRQMGQDIKADLKRATAVEMPQASGLDASDEPVEMPSPFPTPAPATAATLAAVPPDLVAAPAPVVPSTNAPATPMADPAPAKAAPAVLVPAPEVVAKPKRASARKAGDAKPVEPKAAATKVTAAKASTPKSATAKAGKAAGNAAVRALAPVDPVVPAPTDAAPKALKKPATPRAKPTTAKKDNA